jgi:cell division protein FtsI (penicillin-binding protein 3)
VSAPPRGPGAGPRTPGRLQGRSPGTGRTTLRTGQLPLRPGSVNAFTSRRAPGSRRSGTGVSPSQRGMRNRWGLAILVTLLVVVVARLAVLQGVDGAEYAIAAQQSRLSTFPVPALRGQVLDRHGAPFAYTLDASKVTADPTMIADPAAVAKELSEVLHVPVPMLTRLLSGEGEGDHYAELADEVPPETTEAVEKLEIDGIFFEPDPVRTYPAGAVGGQVVGFVNGQGEGGAGIEYRYQDQLGGTPGERRVEVALGHPIPSGIDESTPAVDGSSVTLTIDQDLQYVVEQQLAKACADGSTSRGSAVVLDVHTGEVRAMASCPGFDPAEAARTDPDQLGNPAIQDVFEPGSVMKAVTMSAALEEGVATPKTVLSVDGHIEAGDRTVYDAHDHEPIKWTVTGILAKSSNVGTIMLAREVGDEKLEHYLRAFGLGERTGVELPGESPGILQPSAEWDPGRAANVPIGQGVSVTTLQMASIYQAIANDGVRVEPRVVASLTAPDGTVTDSPAGRSTRVISEDTAEKMAYMLEAVVGPEGTAPLAQIEGFRVAGKTGTAQRANPETGGYAGGGYVTTFSGFAPADDPQYVVAVDLERPTSDAEGGQVAAPVFAEVMRQALTAGGVAPTGAPRPDFDLDG